MREWLLTSTFPYWLVFLMMQVVPGMNAQMSMPKTISNLFRDDAGHLHTSTQERDVANIKIKESKSAD